MLAPISNLRSEVNQTFRNLQQRAAFDSLLAKIFRKDNRLASFYDRVPRSVTNRRYIGLRDIPVDCINGSHGRENDFDQYFRPLKKHLRDRWVNIYLLFTREDVPPIQVSKVGDEYFVEDGHHRVSVARYFDKTYITAEIWEYPLPRVRPGVWCAKFNPPLGVRKTFPVRFSHH